MSLLHRTYHNCNICFCDFFVSFSLLDLSVAKRVVSVSFVIEPAPSKEVQTVFVGLFFISHPTHSLNTCHVPMCFAFTESFNPHTLRIKCHIGIL